MTFKQHIIDDLGEGALLVPARLNAALLANDRVKYLFTLLQNSVAHAEKPELQISNLRNERLSCGLEHAEYDEVVDNSLKQSDTYLLPCSETIVKDIHVQIATMLSPLGAALAAGFTMETNALPEHFQRRHAALTDKVGPIPDNRLTADHLDLITRGLREPGDSLHLLVMDLHKELNRLQALVAEDSIDGASVYLLEEPDHAIVRAFMKGLNRTAPLKFDHPGLGTTATRDGAKLIIQNDIGTTDAHVLVIHVVEQSVSLTYTDVHAERMKFFISLFDPFAVTWNKVSTRAAKDMEQENYYLRIGTYNAVDEESLLRYLEFLGSRLVFLIDWNKARKRLRHFVKKRDAIGLLKWAAEKDYGHRGFLVLGGETFINQAIEYAAKSMLHYGQPLHEMLGRDQAIEYLQYVLEKSSTGLSAGQSEQLLRDEIKTELLKYFQTTYQSFVTIAERHAEIIHDLASLTLSGLIRTLQPESPPYMKRCAERCRHWEHQADDLLNEGRELIRNSSGLSSTLEDVFQRADDSADSLEDTAFLLTLVTDDMKNRKLFARLRHLNELVVQASREYIKSLESAKLISREAHREDLDDFLHAVDQIVKIEHDCDDALRGVTAMIVQDVDDCRHLHLYSEIAESLEYASDALAISSLKLRHYILDDVISSQR